MKKFQFSLEKVMNVKEIEEKILQKKLFLAENNLREAVELQKKLEKEINSEWSKKSSNKLTSNDFMIRHNYLNSLNTQLQDILKDIVKLEAEVEKARCVLLEKVKEKKTLVKLKENKLEEYIKEVKKKDQIIMDEISCQSVNYRNNQ